MADKYNPQEIEPKWQARWKADDLYRTPRSSDKPKHYVLDMYPYPSGDGLSVGHARNYVATDVYARYFRMKGYAVLHPMGFDAFGLPTENAAIKLKMNPFDLNDKFTANFRRQMDLLGLSYDWSRVINTAQPEYYRWTQWIFLRLYESWYDPRLDRAVPIANLERELGESGTTRFCDVSDRAPLQYPRITSDQWRAMSKRERSDFLMKFRLAYRADSVVNWDPVDKVVVANEEVENGRAWRSGALVEKKVLKQWFFRITAYADRLDEDLATLDWPARIVTMQRNWIGRSEGAEVDFPISGSPFSIRIFTTRPDTLWGATFMVLSPEHSLVAEITTPERRKAVEHYIAYAQSETEEQRTAADREKTGEFTGAYAINPVNNERIPIWIADYVLMGYGTGAIMAVPAHDQRDFEFARKFNLPIVMVVQPPGVTTTDASVFERAWEAHDAGQGVMVNSGPLNGLDAGESLEAAIRYVEQIGAGRRRINYKIRDWLISRQRYWGTPIPIIHTPDGEMPLDESELPLELPDVENYSPTATGESPLATIDEWVNTPRGRRETDTMATWACSSWYYLRFADPHNETMPFDPKEVAYWLPVDTYVGGAEHAVLHLLYSRMWMKVLYDLGYVPYIEPFKTLRNQGMILGTDGREKMSKSKGNVIAPDEVIAEHGADALRGYELFISDFTQAVPWNTNGVPGVRRWLDRVWRIVLYPNEIEGSGKTVSDGQSAPDGSPKIRARDLRRIAHQTVMKVSHDIETFAFNTTVSTLMEFTNNLYRARDAGLVGTPEWDEAIDFLVRMIAPIAPHMAEELWQRMGRPYSVTQQPWPVADPEVAREEEITIVVQVNGKVRDRIVVPADADEAMVTQAALATEGARKFINGSQPKQVRYVKGRLVNIVV